MAKQNLFHISLARKCQLLFGLAVLWILAAALYVPGYYMESMVHDRNKQEARRLAMLARARIDPTGTDWTKQQALLDRWWEDNAYDLDLFRATPKLIWLQPPFGVEAPRPAKLKWLKMPQGPLSSPFRKLAKCIQPPMSVGLILNSYRLLPDKYRRHLSAAGQTILSGVVKFGKAVYPPLDKFQRECVREMRGTETLNEMSTAGDSGQPYTYRFVLAVRGSEPESARKPLVGIIDVQITAAKTKEILLWTRIILILAGILAGLLAILVFYLITQKLILAPVRELKDLVERIAGGDLSARSAIATGDEFEELSDAFNNMLGELERSRTELETINRSLDTRLGELAETNVALYESNRLKSEFLANVSHELRTPLTTIIGFADLLRDIAHTDGGVDTGRVTRYAHNILTSGRMLLDIINDLLDLAKIEAGKIEIHRARFSLRDVCEALQDFMKPLIDKKQQTMTMSIRDDSPTMNSDAGKLRQVLYNLLSNAHKYTPAGGNIRLEADTFDTDRQVRLIVADNGPGIAPADQETIFEKFHQLDASVTREHSGTGLGLAISKELCNLLGGNMRLESELGKGTRFIVELPVECPETLQSKQSSIT